MAVRLAVAAALLGLAAACGGSPDTGAAAPVGQVEPAPGKIISPATLKPGQAVPKPAQQPVLTITGKISAANKGRALVFDQRTLERLGVVQVRLYEPWAKKTLEFRGVWLKDLLAVAALHPDAARLHMTALDDYQVDLTMAEVRAGGILVGTQAGDGSSIPIDKGGPARILFLDGVPAGANPDQWIWSLKTIEVR
jgi:hypothetical protein